MRKKLLCCLLTIVLSALPVWGEEEEAYIDDTEEWYVDDNYALDEGSDGTQDPLEVDGNYALDAGSDGTQDPSAGGDYVLDAGSDGTQDPSAVDGNYALDAGSDGTQDPSADGNYALDSGPDGTQDPRAGEMTNPPEEKEQESAVETEKSPEKEEKVVEKTTSTELIIPNGDKEIYGVLYTPEGDANGTVIIMSHGYNGSHNDWVKEGTLFASKGYTAYAYDFCGGSVNSKSSGKTTEMTITSEKEDLLSVINYFKNLQEVKKIFLLGGSQGDFISSLVAAERPDEIGALAMYFPALCVPDDWKNNYPDPADAPETFDFWGMDLSREFVEDVQKIDVFGTIGEYKGQVLIIHGDEDPVVPVEYSERAEETYENCELVKMPGEGHGWSEEALQKVMEMVLEFFEKN